MRSFVIFLLLALLGAIATLLLSNTPSIALTFLGMQSITLPLAIWMLGALLAGVATGLWFVILFRLAARRGAAAERRYRRSEFGPEDFAVVDDYPAATYGSPGQAFERDDYRDFERETYREDPLPEPIEDRPRSRPYAPPVDLESVYDADYRVIQPPGDDRRYGVNDQGNDQADEMDEGEPDYRSEPVAREVRYREAERAVQYEPSAQDSRDRAQNRSPSQKPPRSSDDWDEMEDDLDW